MNLVIASGILDLGGAPSSFGTSLALILTFFVILGGVVNLLIVYIIAQVLVERRQNRERRRSYDSGS
jgi:phage shock protein PspC (stress-responsive transcriptional regulator)